MPVTAAAIKEKADDAAKLERERVALRHFVYCSLGSSLKIANVEETQMIAANLRLPLASDLLLCFRGLPSELHREFLMLRITPDVYHYNPLKKGREVERDLFRTYGERLLDISGFYRNDKGEIKLALPKRCGLLFYHNLRGLLSGVACLPLDESGFYWLLSSKRYGGPKATAMMPESRKFLDQHLEEN